jgi:hypothetical protein
MASEKSLATLVYIPGCPNCARFVDMLKTVNKSTPVKVKAVNALQLHPAQRQGITVVPTLLLRDGRKLEGQGAFKWLDQFSVVNDPAGFGEFEGLPCSHVDGCTSFYGEERLAPFREKPVMPYVDE